MKHIVMLDDRDHYSYTVGDSPEFMDGNYAVYKFISPSEVIKVTFRDTERSFICTHVALSEKGIFAYDVDSKRCLVYLGNYEIRDRNRL